VPNIGTPQTGSGMPQTTNAPPWMKNNQAGGAQQASNKPPGFAPSNPVPATSGNVPPWMKNKQS